MNLSMMDAIIVAGGDIEDDFALGFLNSQKKSPFLVAADRGFGFFMTNGVVPDVVIGDFDSASSEMKSEIEKMENTGKIKNGRSLKVVKLRPEKDDTDTHAAVLAAKESGAVNVAVLGVFGGRIDHLIRIIDQGFNDLDIDTSIQYDRDPFILIHMVGFMKTFLFLQRFDRMRIRLNIQDLILLFIQSDL